MILLIANLLMNACGINSETALKYARRVFVVVLFAGLIVFVLLISFIFRACHSPVQRIDEKEIQQNIQNMTNREREKLDNILDNSRNAEKEIIANSRRNENFNKPNYSNANNAELTNSIRNKINQ